MSDTPAQKSGWMPTLLQLVALYCAFAVQMALFPTAGPQLPLAMAAWILCRSSARTGVVWAIAIGLCLDATGNTRIGLHTAAVGILAAMAAGTVLASTKPGNWQPSLIAFWLAFGDELISQGVLRAVVQLPLDLRTILQQGTATGLRTAAFVIGTSLLCEVVRRCLQPCGSSAPFELQNQWSRLSE